MRAFRLGGSSLFWLAALLGVDPRTLSVLPAVADDPGPVVIGEGLPAGTPRVLMTAFDPFGGSATNTSEDILVDLEQALQAEPIMPEAVLRFEILPVIYGAAENQLWAAMADFHPDAVIALGEAGPDGFRFETTAYNLDSDETPDNAGVVREDMPIDPSGPETFNSTLPVTAIARAIGAAGFPVAISDDPGRFLCNHLFYQLMARAPSGPTGFIHVPIPTGEEDETSFASADMPAIRIALEQTLQAMGRAHR